MNTLGRRVPTDSELAELVKTCLKEFSNRASFTAWDVTSVLRSNDSLLEVTHERVRQVVHGAMETLIAAGAAWDYEMRDYISPDGYPASARTYFCRTIGDSIKVAAPTLASGNPSDYVIKV